MPGLVVEKVVPRFLANCMDSFDMTVLVAGTNGKTTTTKMIRYILEADGKSVINNAAGSNMPRGIISALLEKMDWRGELEADVGLFEIDEGFIADVAEVARPEAIVVLNLLRDQLDRYGELDRTTQLIADALPHTNTAVLNTDDPRVAGLDGQAGRTVFFGAEPHIREQVPHDDALYRKKQPAQQATNQKNTVEVMSAEPTNAGQKVSLQVEEKTWDISLQLSGLFNAYNAAAATALATTLGIAETTVTDALGKVTPAFGRSERITIGDKQLVLLLVKNPAGFNHIITTHLAGKDDTPTLIAINDNHADGRDVSWLWDVDIEQLADTKRPIITSGIRGYDMALRLHYAEITSDTQRDFLKAIDALLERIPEGGEGHIVPTYTAMLQIRKMLARYAELPEAGE